MRPDRETGRHDDDTGQQDADVKELLHRIVAGEIVVAQAPSQRGAEV